MDAVILLEYDAGRPGVRASLLDRIAPLAITGAGRLSFVAAPPDAARSGTEIVAVGFRTLAGAEVALTRWRGEACFPIDVAARLLRIEPIWSIEPLAIMFP